MRLPSLLLALLVPSLALGQAAGKSCVSDRIAQYSDSCALHTDLQVCEAKLAALGNARAAVVYRAKDFSDIFPFATEGPMAAFDELMVQADEAYLAHDSTHAVVFSYDVTLGTTPVTLKVADDRDLWRAFTLAEEMGFTLMLRAEIQTMYPTTTPTEAPTTTPTEAPTGVPTTTPTEVPTTTPTEAPTTVPTGFPTSAPTEAPSPTPTSGPTVIPTPGPTRDAAVSGQYYYYLNEPSMNWADARDFCQSKGMDLASVSSQADNDQIMSMLIAEGVTSDQFWIGGLRKYGSAANCGTSACWEWTNGSPWTYTAWWGPEPNGIAEGCAVYYRRDGQAHDGQWNDWSCHNPSKFLCSAVTPAPTTAADQVSGHFYSYASAGTMTWQQAEDLCLSNGMHLASVTSQADNDLITNLAPGSSWIGGKRTANSGATCGTAGCWAWSNGDFWDYTGWWTGEPNGSHEECAVLYRAPGAAHDGRWNDAGCTGSAYAICSPPHQPAIAPSASAGPFHYYQSMGQLSHDVADSFCVSQGKHLASILSDTETDLVASIVDDHTWIGATRVSSTASCGSVNCWIWSNGDPWSYTKWWTNEPNSATEECAVYYYAPGAAHDKHWNDAGCTNSYRVLCRDD